MSVPALPKDWTGPRYVTRREVAAALKICEATVSRRFSGFSIAVGSNIRRYDLTAIIESYSLAGVEYEAVE
jgi:hypothetical protein